MTDQDATHRPHGHDHGGYPYSRNQGSQPHGHDHGAHQHAHRPGRWARIRYRAAHLAVPHSHQAADKVDRALETSAEGIRTLRISLGVLGLATVLQALVVAQSGSVALLGDTIHNGADALTAVPLGIAFVLGRRPRPAGSPTASAAPRTWRASRSWS